jgi:hypothetical protein
MTYPWNAGDILTAADLNAEFGSKLDLAGGKILQIVRATDASQRATTSTSYVDVTGMSVTITPQKSDSAILLWATGVANPVWSSAVTQQFGFLSIADSSNNPISGAEEAPIGSENVSGTGTVGVNYPFTLIARATPATTSAVTYKLRFRSGNASTTFNIRNNLATGQLYAIEVSA